MSKELIKKYYSAFNQEDIETFLTFLDDNIIHDINQGEKQIGKEAFRKFMQEMFKHYKENVRDLIILEDSSGKHFAAEFIVDGVYQQSASGLPPAKQQNYSLPVGTFFEVNKNKISRVTTYYNLNEWLRQVS